MLYSLENGLMRLQSFTQKQNLKDIVQTRTRLFFRRIRVKSEGMRYLRRGFTVVKLKIQVNKRHVCLEKEG